MTELKAHHFVTNTDKRCLASLELLDTDNTENYTKAAAKRLFQAWPPPKLELDIQHLEELAKAQLNERLAITGVQRKLSAGHSKEGKAQKITVMDAKEEYILKLPVSDFPGICELEHCCMQLARTLDISVAESGLVTLPDESYAFITRRFDRLQSGKRHMEDFAQLLGKFATGNDKYRGSYEQIANQIVSTTSMPMLQLPLFFERVVFSFLTGNADMHLKNFMVFTDDANRIELTPAFDLTPTAILLAEDDEDLALNLCGKKKKLKHKHFIQLYTHFDVAEKVFQDFITKIKQIEDELIAVIHNSFASPAQKNELWAVIRERYARLQP